MDTLGVGNLTVSERSCGGEVQSKRGSRVCRARYARLPGQRPEQNGRADAQHRTTEARVRLDTEPLSTQNLCEGDGFSLGEPDRLRSWPEGDEFNRDVTPRLGVLLNYSPTRILYVSEPFENTIAALDLSDDGTIFHVTGAHRIHSEALNLPVDLAPVTIETTDNKWASNTTINDEESDIYVANRGNNTIVRMKQDGTVVAVREVRLANGRALGNGRLNGIASSPDGTKIWVTVTGQLPGHGNLAGAVLELPAF